MAFALRSRATDHSGCDHARRRGHDTGGVSKGLFQTQSLNSLPSLPPRIHQLRVRQDVIEHRAPMMPAPFAVSYDEIDYN
jgi:hypothetical protein